MKALSFRLLGNLGLTATVVICLILLGGEVICRGPTTLIEPIHLSQEFKKSGYSEEALQQMLIDTFSELRSEASSVTPKPSGKEEAASDTDVPDITVPGTGFSVRPMIDYARSLLRKDSSVSASVAGSTEAFSMMLTLRQASGEVSSFDFQGAAKAAPRGKSGVRQADSAAARTAALKEVLRNAAKEILKHESLLTYAGSLTQIEQSRCIEHGVACKFEPMREFYEQLAARESDGKKSEAANPAWARLALAKLDTFERNPEGAIVLAREIVESGDAHPAWSAAKPWAYYSWGVALNDLGCYGRASDVLLRAVRLNPRYAAAYNALARSYLALARADGDASMQASAGSLPARDYRKDALERLKQAIDLDPDYQEAYVNLGDVLSLPPRASADRHAAWPSGSDEQSAELSRKAYRDAVALNLDTAAHAYERLAALHDTTYRSVSSRIMKKQLRCNLDMVRSLRESWGCADADAQPPTSSKGGLRHAGFERGETRQAVCNRPDLILDDKGSARLPVDGPSTVVAARSAPLVPGRPGGVSNDTLRKVSVRED